MFVLRTEHFLLVRVCATGAADRIVMDHMSDPQGGILEGLGLLFFVMVARCSCGRKRRQT